MSLYSSLFANYRHTLFVLVWIFGLVALTWGMFSLHNIFSRERNDAASEVLSRHKTVEQYAFQALVQSLQQQLAIANVNLRHVLRDPLMPSENILYFEGAKQVLPRPSVYKSIQTPENQAKKLYQELMDIEPVDLVADNLSPWGERQNLLSNFKLAVESNNADEIRWAFREISEQRVRANMPGDTDIPYMIAVVDYLVTFGSPEKTLVQNIIRNGSIIDQEQGNYGLQRSLISQRHLFSKQEFEFLRDMIISVSVKFDIPYADFLHQSQVENQLLNINSEDITTPALLSGNQWYVEPRDNSLLGVAIHISSTLMDIEQNMKDIGLLKLDDSVQYSSTRNDALSLDNIVLTVKSGSLKTRMLEVKKLYRLKTVILFAIAILVVSIAVLVNIIQYRKQRYLSQKAEFVATVSHELKTPLASVRILAETLLRKTKDFAPVKDYPSRIIKTIDGMSLLVDNILSFNRLNKGAWQLKKSPVYLEEVVSSLKQEFIQYTSSPVNIELENLDDVEFNADIELIKMLFRNLINNASKYNDQDSVNVLIKAQGTQPLRILFKDNGIGIAKKNWTLVFDEFSRVVETTDKTISGTGLGLTICKKIMQLHDGDINIIDSSAQGTVIELTFAAT